MITAVTEQFSRQSLDDVSCSFQIPYQTRSKTRAQQQNNVYKGVFTGSNLFPPNPPSITILDRDDPGPEERPRSKSHTYIITSKGQNCTQEQDDEEAMSVTPPHAPPKKRHCRSMSAGEVMEGRAHSNRWKPRASKVWRPPVHTSSRDGHPGHSPLSKAACFNYHRLSSHIPSSKNAGANSNLSEYSTPPDSPVPRPLSASSWDGGYNPPFWLERCNFRPVMSPRSFWKRLMSSDDRDRMSESSGSVTSVSSCMSDSIHEMELRNEKVVQRCKSQPCVPVSRRGGKKRRREEELRPKLDLFKMESERLESLKWDQRHKGELTQKDDGVSLRPRQTRSQALNCTKPGLRSTCRLKCNPEEFMGLKTIASSPGETNSCLLKHSSEVPSPEDKSNSSSIMITPTCSPTLEATDPKDPHSRHRNISKDDGYHGDSDCEETADDNLSDKDVDDEIFPIDSCSELDLEQIEKY